MCTCTCTCSPSPPLPTQPFSTSHQQSSSASAHESSDTKPHPSNEDRSHAKKSVSKKHNHSRSRSHSPAPHSKRRCSSDASNGSDKDSDKRSGEPSVFTFDTSQMHPSHHIMPPPPLNTTDAGTMTARARGVMPAGPKGATLDDLCRAVEALEKMENGSSGGLNQHGKDSDEDDKRRPGNIHIPTHTSPSLDRDRHRFGSTPPYTPPPILSPARSMAMLAAPGTPSRILQPWSCRRSSDHRKPSEAEEGSYPEPKINVGRQFQAVLPPCDGQSVAVLWMYVCVCVCVCVCMCVCMRECIRAQHVCNYNVHFVHAPSLPSTFPHLTSLPPLPSPPHTHTHSQTEPTAQPHRRLSTMQSRCGSHHLILWRRTRASSTASWSWPAPPPSSMPAGTRSMPCTSYTVQEAL